jgi:hypothetical protein
LDPYLPDALDKNPGGLTAKNSKIAETGPGGTQ